MIKAWMTLLFVVLVLRAGAEDVSIYDWTEGTYTEIEITEVSPGEVEVYNYDTGDFYTVEVEQ